MSSLFLLTILTGIDNFQASAGIGLSRIGRGRKWAFVGAFALFETAMPLLGAVMGNALAARWAESLGWIGPALLLALGATLVVTGARSQLPGTRPRAESLIAGRWVLAALPLALALDNLAVGAALGALGYPPLAVALAIGTGCGALGAAGMFLSDRLGALVPAHANALGGAAMILVAFLALING